VIPFLFLGTRPEDDAADSEYVAALARTGLDESTLLRHRLETAPLGLIELSDWSGVLVGGGPFNVSDPEPEKSPVQRRVEVELRALAEQVIAADFPFFGACYGIGTLGVVGGAVDRTYGEPVSCVTVTLTDAGRADPLFKVLPESFSAFVGHKEAVTQLPEGAVCLASSSTCPVQALRIGDNVYATQFHPELDADGLCTRVDIYRDHGYFDPGEVGRLHAMARASDAPHPQRLLSDFVSRYAR
jgi:GMP synthase (glutamine-hydrolysing)